MKKYVFLTQSISGITGNQRYVNNKTNWLRQNGWEVIVLWNYNVSPVVLQYVRCFDCKRFIHHELKFYPSWFNIIERNKVLKRLAMVIGDAEQIVIESNKLELGAWGELLAKRIKCKHINFITSEGVSIQNQATFDYCYSKLLRNEFFNINSAAVTLFFSNYTVVQNPDKYFWSASQGVDVEEYSFPSFDDLPQSDFTITHFGRDKEYIPHLVSEISAFASSHTNKTINVFFLGDSIKQDLVIKSLALPNVNVAFHSNVAVIPKQVFMKSDVVIASAGCATIASEYMPYVISMDVNTLEPLGLLNRTTLDTNVSSGKFVNKKSISEWLNSLLIKGDSYPLLNKQRVIHDFDYQIKFIDNCDYKYIDSTKVNELITQHDRLYSLFVKIGLFHLVEYFYFKRRGVKVIWR